MTRRDWVGFYSHPSRAPKVLVALTAVDAGLMSPGRPRPGRASGRRARRRNAWTDSPSSSATGSARCPIPFPFGCVESRHCGTIYPMLSDAAAAALTQHQGQLFMILEQLPNSTAEILRQYISVQDED